MGLAGVLASVVLTSACKQPIPTLLEPWQHLRVSAPPAHFIETLDLDSDGWPDVVIGGEGETPLTVRPNLRNGRLGTATRLRLDTSETPHDLGVLRRSSRGPVLAVLLDTGVALLVNPDGLGWHVPPDGRVARCDRCDVLVPGDFDGDGESDLLVVGPAGADLYLGPNLDQVTLPRPPRILAAPRPRPADANGDGSDDLVALRDLGEGPEAVLLLGAPSGVFGARLLPADLVAAMAVGAADLDGDGKKDIVFARTGEIGVLSSTSEWRTVSTGAVPGLDPAAIETLDANGDGLDDLAIADRAGLVRLYLGTGDLSLRVAEPATLSTAPADLTHADLDRDGYDEVLVVTVEDTEPARLWTFRGGLPTEARPTLRLR